MTVDNKPRMQKQHMARLTHAEHLKYQVQCTGSIGPSVPESGRVVYEVYRGVLRCTRIVVYQGVRGVPRCIKVYEDSCVASPTCSPLPLRDSPCLPPNTTPATTYNYYYYSYPPAGPPSPRAGNHESSLPVTECGVIDGSLSES